MARLPQRVSAIKKKATTTPQKSKATPVAPVPVASESEDEDADILLDEGDNSEKELDDGEDASEDSEDEEEDEGVDEAGLKRLMSALGDDGLDEFELAQLGSLQGGDTEDDEEAESDAEVEEDSEDGSQGGSDEEDEQVEGALSDESSDEEEDEEDSAIGKAGPSHLSPEDDDEDIALDEVDYVDEDAVPRQKIEVDNTIALRRIRETIQLDPKMPWTETLAVTYPEKIEVDAEDDLTREVAFYKQALHSAQSAKALAAKHNLPFSRPADYFAEMVKSDSHMERIRQRLLDEKAGIVRGEQKRREREGKKFGKQIQLEKQRERERSKKDMEDRLKGLKRKRKGALDNAEADEGDKFDVAVEDAIADRPAKRGRSDSARGRGGGPSRMPRSARDSKFGFGSASKRSKQNTKSSTDDFDGPSHRGSGRGGRGGSSRGRGGRGGGGGTRGSSKRLGKSRRMSQKQ